MIVDVIETMLGCAECLPNSVRTYVNSVKLLLKYLAMMCSTEHFNYNSDKLRVCQASLDSLLQSLVQRIHMYYLIAKYHAY